MAQIVKGLDMFKDFYRTTLSSLKSLLLLLVLLLPFSLCIADEYISIDNDWDEIAQNQWRNPWDEIARNHKTYYFENGLDHFNQGQYKQAFKDFKLAQEYSIGLGNVYLAKMYLEGKGVKVDYKKAQFYAQNAIKGYGSGLLGGALILGRMQAEGLGMKKDLKQALKTYRNVVRMFSNKSTNYFANNFRLPNLAFTSMLIGSRFIDLSGLSANPIKFGRSLEYLLRNPLKSKIRHFFGKTLLKFQAILLYSNNKWGRSFIELESLIKKGLALENKKIGLKNSYKNPQNLAMKKPWKLCSF